MATTLESLSSAASGSLSDQATQQEFWRSAAPTDILSAKQWRLWSRHLATRREPRPVAALCRASQSPLRWGLAISRVAPHAVELLALADGLHAKPKKKRRFDAASAVQALSVWLEQTRLASQSSGFAVECLAAAHLLPAVAIEATEELWWRILDELWQVVQSTADWRAEADMPAEDAFAQQLFTGELPLTLAYLFPEIRPLFRLRETAAEAISEGLIELTNGEGLLRGSALGVYRPLVASWTRSHAVGRRLKKGCSSAKAAEQFDYFASQALALSAPDGAALLGEPHNVRWDDELLAAVVRLGGPLEASAAKQMFPKRLTRAIVGKATRRNPLTSDNCEWSGVCLMRAAWEPQAPVVAVDYSSHEMRLEAWSSAQKLFDGVWDSETLVDGKRLEPVSDWENTCWYTDRQADYLELSLDLGDGARLERQILLARNDQILYVVDNVHLRESGNISHRTRLPLDSGVDFHPQDETREGLLAVGKLRARVLPLALPEWRTDPRFGQLTAADSKLQLEQHRPGRNLSCPLLVDLSRARAAKPCTWRQLTVGESLQIMPHDVAVGYRAQCGKAQWIFYRSLGPRANRTIIGQNTSSEFLAARFLAPSGKIEELVEIEGY